MGIIKLKNANEEQAENITVEEQQIYKTAVEAQVDVNVPQDEQEQWDDPAVLHEDETRTDENSRHFVLNNGTAKSVFNAEPVSFFDEEEKKWKHIDNSLEEKDDAFESKSGKFKTRISKVHKGKTVAISKSDKQLSWEYLGKQVAAVANENVEDVTETVLKVNNGTQGVAKHINSSAVYENIEKDTDLEYCLLGNNLKENIIVKEKSADYRYLFALKTEGLKLRLSDDNESLELYTEKEKEDGTVEQKVEFTIPSPYMYDANGVASDDVYYELEPSEDGKFAFAVVANEEWVNATDRAFPVTIDPQVVTSQNNLVTKQTYYRDVYSSYGSGSGSGISYSNWYTTSSTYIKVYATSYIEYKTNLTIKRSLINLMEGKISSVKLILTPYGSFSGRMYVNGSLTNYYYASNGKLELDITSRFKANAGDFTVTLEPYTTYSNMQFYLSDNPPVIEIEYLTNENVRPTKKTFTLAGIATGEVNLANGSMVTSICDVKPENSVMGMGIYHIHKRNADNYSLGGNFRLNLNETLVRYDDGDYIYTDSNGDKHGFHDYYYYINNSGTKKYIADKSLIVVDAEGRMTYTESNQTYSVTCEYKSTTGLKAMATLEGVKNVDYFEQRSDAIKENQEKIESYYNALNGYVMVNKSSGTIRDTWHLKNYLEKSESFSTFMSELGSTSYLLLSESEAIAYLSLIKQKQGYSSYYYGYDIVPDEYSINENLLSVKYSLYEITQTLLKYVQDTNFPGVYKDNIVSNLNTDSTIPESYYSDLPDDWTDSDENKITKSVFDSHVRQRHLLMKQLEVQSESVSNQLTLINEQLDLYIAKKELYIKQITKYYREYVSLLAEQKTLERQMPINFLSNGHYIKGFNAEGKFVALYDRYENYAVIEYESYYEGTEEKSRIARVYDNTEKQVVFGYNEKNQLTAITGVRGRKTCFTYNSSNVLTDIVYNTGENLTITYSNNNIYSLKETKNGLLTYIYYSYNRPTQISHYSTVDNIAVDGETTGNKFISQVIIAYNPYSSYPITSTTVTDNLVAERYYFDASGNCTGYRKADFDIASNQYLVSVAEQYTHNPYWIGSEQQSDPKEVVITAARSSLNNTALDSYSFVSGDTETTVIDQFNNPVSKTTSAVLVSEWTDSNGAEQQNKQTTTVSYVYDDNQKLVQETIVVSDSNPAKTVTSYKKYNYNAYGDVIRTESYVQGEEYTTGKTIEETVYDDKGNVIKSFTYNSLDTSSKFYTETEYDENGKVTAELDETGENKTKFGYVDGTSTVREEVLPNGSKFAYGRDYDDTVTAISQSTEDGEENSTQKVYRYGAVVELKSGNNNVKYAYNHKRKLKAVELNGVENYVQYSYAETQDSYGAVAKETVTATYQSGDVFVSEKDGKGNLLKLTANGVVQLENDYDKKGQLDTSKDKVTGKNYKFERDELDNVTAIYEIDGSGIQVSGGYGESVSYDEAGCIKKKTISGTVSQVYDYTYKTHSLHTLESIAVGDIVIKPEVDIQGRNRGKYLYINNVKIGEENISYRKVSDHATNMPSTVWFGDKTNGTYQIKDSIRYAYDKMGNIEKVYENGELAIRYQYDALNRLVREDNKTLDKTYVFVYDNNGNIVKRREFVFTLKDNTLIEELESTDKAYIYNGDQMVSYNGQTCVYDVMGNPTTYRGKTATWVNGRRLASYNGHTFTYDGQGRRLTKDNVVFAYDSNSRLIKQGDNMEFFYDQTGVVGLKYSGTTYLYRKDAQNNVLALINESGAIVARYLYDAWGTVSVVDNNGALISDTNHIGNLNPFRYRGYYYDTETKLYFLKTRYYDPEIGRFMTIDGIEYLNPETINGLNLYAYCGNNPVMRVDENGNAWWNWLISGLQIVAGIVLVATGVGAGLGASLIVGGTLGMVGNIVGSQIAGGLGSMANGWGAISTGLSLFSYGWVGAIAGGVMVAVGAGTMAFGANEVVAGVTGTNYIQEWTGMSDSLYGGLYFGLNIVSSIGTIAGRLGMRAYSTSTISGHSHLSRQGQLPYAKITRGNTIVHFDGRGNMYWSKHNALHGGKIGNPHWHSELRGHGAERSWLGMVFELIFNELFRR